MDDRLSQLNKQWNDLVISLPLPASKRLEIASLHAEIAQEILKTVNKAILSEMMNVNDAYS